MEPGLTNAENPRQGLVTVVLITWNSARYLPRCLAGITHQRHPELQLVHVDNASADDSAAIVHAAFPECMQIINTENRGFTGAANQGVAAARGEFLLFCNPDAFLERDYIARLVEAFAIVGDNFGMATGKLMRATDDDITPTDLVDSKGIRMTRTGRHFDIGQGLRDGAPVRGLGRELERRESGVGGRESERWESGVGSRESENATSSDHSNSNSDSLPPTPNPRHPTSDPQPPTPNPRLYEVFGVSGAAAMYRRSFVDDVTIDGQFLDEDFFTYREDADVAWRGRILGWRALYAPEAIGYHVRRVTPEVRRDLPPNVNMHSVKNRFLLRLKNEGWYLALRNAPFELPRDFVAIIAILTVERSSLPALVWLWKNRRRIMEKRRAIQRRRRTSDRDLAGWFC